MNPELDNLVIDTTAGSAPVQTANPNPVLSLQLELNMVNAIIAALAEMPFRVSDPVIREITRQAQPQLG